MKKIIRKISAVSVAMIVIFQYSYVFAFSKSEMVFTNLDSNGEVKSTVVNNRLILDENEKNSTVEDNSELENIININGEEGFTLKGSLLQWETASKNVYYQGNTKNVVPVAVDIKYYLNGEEKKLEEMDGKSGEITIEIKFTNNLKNRVKINGSYRDLYTPFVVLVGTMVPNNNNSNIEVTNGKIVDTGTKSVIAAISSPGLYESIDLDEFKDFDIVKISYNTTSFDKNSSIYISATPKLIDNADLKIFDKLNDLSSNINKLQENMNKIEDGANKLKDGAKELENGAKTLTDGTVAVNDGAKSVNDGVGALKNGTESLASGTKELNKGASTLANGAKDLNAGASSVADGIDTISSKLQEVVNGVDQLKNGAVSLDEGVEKILLSVKDAKKIFESKEVVQIINVLKTLKSTNAEAANKIIEAYNKYNLADMDFSTILNDENIPTELKIKLITIKSNFEDEVMKVLNNGNNIIDGILTKFNTVKTSVDELENALKQVKGGTTQLANGLATLETGVSQLYDGSVTLSNGANKLKAGTVELSKGANKLSTGANALEKGAKELNNGANNLKDGTNKLVSGTSELTQGAKTLSNGSNELSNGTEELANGIAKFNREGIQKLSSYSNKISEYSDIIEALVNLSKEYKGFTCNNANITNFIYVIK